ncbi:MAG: hypothetical protein QM731_17555 [Chitinophagaceae bacterium]
MKPTTCCVLIISFATLLSCKNNHNKADNNNILPVAADTTGQSTPYLPVNAILSRDKKLADSFATTFLKRAEMAGKKDSAYISPEEFGKLAAAFFPAELQDSLAFRQNYTESSVMDETMGLLNFIYIAKKPETSLQQVVVYVSPEATTDQINRVYMERTFTQGDTLIRQKLTWKLKQYFYTITIKQPANGEPVVINEKVIWNPAQFQEE